MARPTARARMPKGAARAPKVAGLDGRDCLHPGCGRPSTQWRLSYYCDTHVPPVDGIRGGNCGHVDTVEMHGVLVCSWCQAIVKHDV